MTDYRMKYITYKSSFPELEMKNMLVIEVCMNKRVSRD